MGAGLRLVVTRPKPRSSRPRAVINASASSTDGSWSTHPRGLRCGPSRRWSVAAMEDPEAGSGSASATSTMDRSACLTATQARGQRNGTRTKEVEHNIRGVRCRPGGVRHEREVLLHADRRARGDLYAPARPRPEGPAQISSGRRAPSELGESARGARVPFPPAGVRSAHASQFYSFFIPDVSPVEISGQRCAPRAVSPGSRLRRMGAAPAMSLRASRRFRPTHRRSAARRASGQNASVACPRRSPTQAFQARPQRPTIPAVTSSFTQR